MHQSPARATKQQQTTHDTGWTAGRNRLGWCCWPVRVEAQQPWVTEACVLRGMRCCTLIAHLCFSPDHHRRCTAGNNTGRTFRLIQRAWGRKATLRRHLRVPIDLTKHPPLLQRPRSRHLAFLQDDHAQIRTHRVAGAVAGAGLGGKPQGKPSWERMAWPQQLNEHRAGPFCWSERQAGRERERGPTRVVARAKLRSWAQVWGPNALLLVCKGEILKRGVGLSSCQILGVGGHPLPMSSTHSILVALLSFFPAPTSQLMAIQWAGCHRRQLKAVLQRKAPS